MIADKLLYSNSILYNSKVIETLANNFKSTLENRKEEILENTKTWLSLLKNGDLKSEQGNYTNFNNHVLRGILGYDGNNIKDQLKQMDFSIVTPNESNEDVDIHAVFEVKENPTNLFKKYSYNDGRRTPMNQTWQYMGKNGIGIGVCSDYDDFLLIAAWSNTFTKYHHFKLSSVMNNDGDINYDKLVEFIMIFGKESILNNYEKTIHETSIKQQDDISEEFYKLYHETRNMMLNELIDKKYSKSDSVKYTQMYLNRLIFCFFIEDSKSNDLLPDKYHFANIIDSSLGSLQINDKSSETFKHIINLFNALDKGNETAKIFEFNGGLFKEEMKYELAFNDFHDLTQSTSKYDFGKIDDRIKIQIQTLNKNNADKNLVVNPIIVNLLKMSSYDFTTELDVNILGHIFEQSINDLENFQQTGKISERKEKGIFYTPEYITDYIARATIIPYLSVKNNVMTSSELVEEYVENGDESLEDLMEKIKSIKILDPACGSGAFLTKCADVLFGIYTSIQLYKIENEQYNKSGKKVSKKSKNTRSLDADIEEYDMKTIIANNIYGVDLNNESVTISKLSMFLKIADLKKKLPTISKNILSGNSLIDPNSSFKNTTMITNSDTGKKEKQTTTITGKTIDPKAFCWNQEFKEIMDGGGFDIIVGNPPYIKNSTLDENEKIYFDHVFTTIIGNYDIYQLFFEQCHKLLKNNGRLGFITSNKYVITKSGGKTRSFIFNNFKIDRLVDVSYIEDIFDADVYPFIIIMDKKMTLDMSTQTSDSEDYNHLIKGYMFRKSTDVTLHKKPQLIRTYDLFTDDIIYVPSGRIDVIQKINSDKKTLGDYCLTKELIHTKNVRKYLFFNKADVNENITDYAKCLEGKTVKRYGNYYKDKVILKNPKSKSKCNIVKYPDVNQWFLNDKLLVCDIGWRLAAIYDNEQFYGVNTLFGVILKENVKLDLRYILAVINSDIIHYWFKNKYFANHVAGGYLRYKLMYLETIPIPVPTDEVMNTIIDHVDTLVQTKALLINSNSEFLEKLETGFKAKLTSEIKEYELYEFENWYEKLVEKNKKLFSGSDTYSIDNLKDYFNNAKNVSYTCQEIINETESKIESELSKLFSLTDEDVKIIKKWIKDDENELESTKKKKK